jgi:uncharacterized membrane protein YqiK
LQKIQSQPQAAKIRIMWIVSVIVVVLMIAVWIISSRFGKTITANTVLFKTIGQGIKNIGENYNKK